MVSRAKVAFGGISRDATVSEHVYTNLETGACFHTTGQEPDLGGFYAVYFITVLVTDGPACRALCP